MSTTDEESKSLLGRDRAARQSNGDGSSSRGNGLPATARDVSASASAAAASSSAAIPASAASASSRSSSSSSSGPTLHLTVLRGEQPRLEIAAPSSWTLAQLRDFAYPPGSMPPLAAPSASSNVAPSSSAAAPNSSSSSSSAASSSTAPTFPPSAYPAVAGAANVAPAASSASAASAPAAPAREVIVLYLGRKLPASAWTKTLGELGFRSGTSVHILVQDVLPPPRSARAAGGGAFGAGGYQSGPNANDAEEEDMSMFDHHHYPDHYDRYGSWWEFVLGVCLGFLLGILSLIWLLQPALSSRVMRLGILVGLSLNISMGLSRFLWGERQAGPAGAPPFHREDAAYDEQGNTIQPRGPALIGPVKAGSPESE